MAIERLNQGTWSSASQLPFYDPQNGQDKRGSVSDLATVLQAQLSPSGGLITQYASPNASGFTVTVSPPTTGASMFLLLSPGGTYAAGTLVLPIAIDGQELLVHSRQTVTALTITPASGDASSGAPTTIAAGGFFRLRYDFINKLWCRVA